MVKKHGVAQNKPVEKINVNWGRKLTKEEKKGASLPLRRSCLTPRHGKAVYRPSEADGKIELHGWSGKGEELLGGLKWV